MISFVTTIVSLCMRFFYFFVVVVASTFFSLTLYSTFDRLNLSFFSSTTLSLSFNFSFSYSQPRCFDVLQIDLVAINVGVVGVVGFCILSLLCNSLQSTC